MANKLKFRFRVEKRVLISLITSYLVILFLPVAAWLGSLSLYSGTIQAQTDELNKSMLQFIVHKVNNEFDRIIVDSYITSSDTSLKHLNIDKDAPFYIEPTLKLQGIMSHYVASNELIDNMFIYFYDQDCIISHNTKANASLFFKSEYSREYVSVYSGFNFDEWKNFLQGTTEKGFSVFPNVSSKDCSIFYILPIHFDKTLSRQNAVLVVETKYSSVTSLINSVNTIKNSIVEIYYRNHLIWSQDIHFDANHPDVTEKYVIAQIGSTEGIRYVSYIPKEIYTSKMDGLRRITAFFLIAALGLCVIAIIYSLSINYNPLNDLILHLEKSLQKHNNTNEFDYLKSTFDYVLHTSVKKNKLLQLQQEQLQKNCLERLMLGNVNEENANEYGSILNMDFANVYTVVLLLRFEDENITYSMLKKDIESDIFNGYSLEINGTTAFLINCTGMDDERLRIGLKELNTLIDRMYGFHTMAVSKAYKGIDNIHREYLEALYCMEYAQVTGCSDLVMYNDIAGKGKGHYYYPAEIEHQLIAAMISGNEQQARQLVNHIWEHNKVLKQINLRQARLLKYNINASMLRTFNNSINKAEADIFFTKLKSLDTVYDSTSKIYSEIISEIEYICKLFREKNEETEQNELRQRVIRYIDENYSDPDLSVEKLCSVFDRSRSTLFLLFKEGTGNGLLDQINRTRIHMAKRFLADHRMSINDIMKKVGYLNASTFLRVFKRYEGISPSQYREILRTTMDKEHTGKIIGNGDNK